MKNQFKIFEAFGIELEYMIVDSKTLDVKPVSDVLLRGPSGEVESEIEVNDEIAWSNELVSHVIELKTNGPKPHIMNYLPAFEKSVRDINQLLEEHAAKLLPGGMHPWMIPDLETKLWPHEYNAVYEAFNRIFDCRGHGWSNLQSSHLNLSFSDDSEFFRLHEAIRFLLPILPVITAASPFAEARFQNCLDYRLKVYQNNCARIPSVTGKVIPESVSSASAYQREILEKMYSDIDEYDPDKILQYEWLNARGAIARFDRGAIEIRTIDNQECPLADFSIFHAIELLIKDLVRQMDAGNITKFADRDESYILFGQILKEGGDLRLDRRAQSHLEQMGVRSSSRQNWKEVWHQIFEEKIFPFIPEAGRERSYFNYLLKHSCLAERILKMTGESPNKNQLRDVYEKLSYCLNNAEIFE